jgi:hypothetical protein
VPADPTKRKGENLMSKKTKTTVTDPMTDQERAEWIAVLSELRAVRPDEFEVVRNYVKFIIKNNQARAKADASKKKAGRNV